MVKRWRAGGFGSLVVAAAIGGLLVPSARDLPVAAAASPAAATAAPAEAPARAAVTNSAVGADLPATALTGIAVSTASSTGPAGSFSSTYGAIAVDYQSRKVTARLSDAMSIERIVLASNRSTTRMAAANWSIYVSQDDKTYTQVTGWTWQQTATSTGLNHTFTGFKVTARYVKVTTNYTDSAFTFVLGAPNTDFRVYPSIPLRVSFKLGDWYPNAGRAWRFLPTANSTSLDTRAQSLNIDFFDRPVHLDTVQLVSAGTSSRLTQAQYQLWVSDDNLRYTQLTGWTFSSGLQGGRLAHTFGNLDVTTKYLKIRNLWEQGATTFNLPDPINDVRIDGTLLQAQDFGQLDIISQRYITTDATFPDAPDPSKVSALSPSIVRADNGDVIMLFNTSIDGNPGDIRIMRSTDGGTTWGPSSVWMSPTRYAGGSVGVNPSFTKLPDGTLLIVVDEIVNNSRFDDREGVKYVVRSTDNGVTWTGKDQPITLPTPIREPFASNSPILRTQSGTLLLTIWGVKVLPPNSAQNPGKPQTGVLRSFDNGQTWSDYRVIGVDTASPPNTAPFTTTPSGAGSSEVSILQSPSGRLVAVLRHDGIIENKRFEGYRSYSDDDGATWSTPVPINLLHAAGYMVPAPCNSHLTGGKTKWLMGDRGLERLQNTVLSVSYDDGVSWHDEKALAGPPEWQGMNGPLTGEPDFLPLNDRDVLVVYQITQNQSGLIDPDEEAVFRVYANVIRDAAPTDCEAQANDAIAAQNSTIRFTVERADRLGWAWSSSSIPAQFPSTASVNHVINSEAPHIGCTTNQTLALRKKGTTVALNPNVTLAAAGVQRGDVLELYNPAPPTAAFTMGFSDLNSHPTLRKAYNFATSCQPARIAFDLSGRSVDLDVTIPTGKKVSSVAIKNLYGQSRLTSANYTILSSADNVTYTPVSGWTLTSTVTSGRQTHTFTGLAVTQRYLRIAENTTNSGYTFVIDDPASNITVGFS